MSDSKPYEKNTTFTKRPGFPQLASYAIFILKVVLLYAAILPHLDQPAQVTLGVLYSLSLVAMVVANLVTSAIDPSDQAMVLYRTDREKFQEWRKGYEGKLLFCDYCMSYVKENSRHCRACDRCVEHFDHHCMWINSCVGGLNYRAFLAMIVATCIHLSIYVTALALLTQQNQYQDYLPGFIAAWVSGAINVVFVFLLLNLIVLHLYLIAKNITTYEFIIAQREEERTRQKADELKKDKVEGQSQKVVYPSNMAVSKHQDEGNSEMVFNADNKRGRSSQGEQERAEERPQRVRVRSSGTESNGEQSSEERGRKFIFGQKDMTHKSQQKSEIEREGESSSQSESSVKVSQLFTRNKSLKLIIGKNQTYRPHKATAPSKSRSPERLKVHSMLT